MAKDRIHPAERLTGDEPDRRLARFLADEEPQDRRALWRLGGWGVGAVAAVTLAFYANQSEIGLRRDQLALADLVRQTRQVQQTTQQAQLDTRRLVSAVETLNGDRDRLYTRVTVLEQGLDSVTGSIGRQTAAASKPPSGNEAQAQKTPAPTADAPATQPTPPAGGDAQHVADAAPGPPLMPSKSIMAPPDPAATKFNETPTVIATAEPRRSDAAVQRTEFGLDLGSASSIDRVRGLWLRLAKAHAELGDLRPLVAIREQPGTPGVQIHLIAGPFVDAAAAARVCAMLTGSGQACEPSVFDGQRLALEAPVAATRKRPPAKRPPAPRPRVEDPAAPAGPR